MFSFTMAAVYHVGLVCAGRPPTISVIVSAASSNFDLIGSLGNTANFRFQHFGLKLLTHAYFRGYSPE